MAAMSTILSSHPETSIWSAPSAPQKLHSRSRETETACCAGVSITKSLECIEIPQCIYESCDGLGLLSKDPIGFDAGDTNLYRMTGNHPNMATDPSGLQEPEKKPVGIFFPTRSDFEKQGEHFTKPNLGFWGGYRPNASYNYYLGYSYGVTDERVMYSRLGFDPDSVTATLRFTEVYRDKFAYLELKGKGTDGKETIWFGMYEGGYQGKPHIGYTFYGSEATLRYNLTGMDKAEALESLGRSYSIVSMAGIVKSIPMGGRIVPPKYSIPPKYLFEKNGLRYESVVERNKDGSTSLYSYIVGTDGEKKLVGISGVSKEGKLDHALQVPAAWQKQGIQTRIYAEADNIGWRYIEGSYGPTSTNFLEFAKHYDPTLGNKVEALFTTPAGKAARDRGLFPTILEMGEDGLKVRWEKP